MAESFNELDVQSEREEITQTHVYKGYTLVHKIRLHGRRRKGMAESFNELDVQHEREEITHTRVQRVQAQYTLGNDACTVRVQMREISIYPPGWPCQNFFKHCTGGTRLCNGTTTVVRVKTLANRYTARAGHAKPLYKGYTYSKLCAILHAQLRVQNG